MAFCEDVRRFRLHFLSPPPSFPQSHHLSSPYPLPPALFLLSPVGSTTRLSFRTLPTYASLCRIRQPNDTPKRAFRTPHGDLDPSGPLPKHRPFVPSCAPREGIPTGEAMHAYARERTVGMS